MLIDLEKYLNKNRSRLDTEKPDDQLIWEGIRQGLHNNEKGKAKKIRLQPFFRFRNIAAIIIISLSLGYVIYDLAGNYLAGKQQTSLSDLDLSLGEREKEYQNLVRLKQEELKTFMTIENYIITELIGEIQRLDTIYDQAMDDLNELGYNEKVIHTIFDTYEKKIQLLELIILETNKTRNNENMELKLL